MRHSFKYLFLFLFLTLFLLPEANSFDVEGSKTKEIKVEVAGAVENPGIFVLPAYSTVADLLSLVEISEEADLSNINQTTVLKNHDKISIPEAGHSALQVSINLADSGELTLLPGVGPKTAENIVEYRNQHGYFQSLDDLIKVKGIGAKTLEKIRAYIKL